MTAGGRMLWDSQGCRKDRNTEDVAAVRRLVLEGQTCDVAVACVAWLQGIGGDDEESVRGGMMRSLAQFWIDGWHAWPSGLELTYWC